jgi:hypothetical protein
MNETLYTRNRPSKLQIFSFDFCAIMHVNTIFMKAGIMNVPKARTERAELKEHDAHFIQTTSQTKEHRKTKRKKNGA